MSERCPIAVVGVSAMFPGARSAREFWSNIVSGVDAVGPVPPGRLNGASNSGLAADHRGFWPASRGGFLPDGLGLSGLELGIPPTLIAEGDPDQFFAIALARDALRDRGALSSEALRERTDVVIGRGGYMSNRMADVYLRAEAIEHVVAALPSELRADVSERLYDALPEPHPDTLETCMPNLVASRVANRLDLGGAAYVVDGACASSLLAVEQVVSRLRTGKCDLGIAMGMHLFHTPGFWYMFHQLGALSKQGRIRPFDARADGLLPSEGGGAVVLRRLDDAVRDGQSIYAVIRGVGVSSDGRETSVLSPDSSGQVRALRHAYADAGLDPDRVSLVEAHGTATLAGDVAELSTLREVFGARRGPAPTRCLGSVKSMIGHAMPAAGMAALIKTIFALANKTLPPTLHCEEPRPELASGDFYVTSSARPWVHARGVARVAGVNAFGFGGINAHVVVEEAEGRSVPFWDALPQPTQLFVASARDDAGLLDKLRQQRLSIDMSDLEAVSRESIRGDQDGVSRLAIVASSSDDLKAKLDAAALAIEGGQRPPDGVFFGRGDSQGKVAFVFPGVGFPGLIGNYPSHVMAMALHFPEVREVLDAVEVRDSHPDDPTPTSLILSPPETLTAEAIAELRSRVAALPADVNVVPHPSRRNISTSCVTVTHLLSHALLQAMGIEPDMVCGQSQGELAALVAGGVVALELLVDHAWENVDLAASYEGGGRLAYAGASERALERFLDEDDDLDIAIHVSPNSQILAGTDAAIERVIARLRESGIMAQSLPYPPIHSRQLASMRDRIEALVPTATDLRAARVPVYSAITMRPFPDDADAIRELALGNLDRPVRFWQTIRAMREAGASVFVQTGGGTLAANMRSILSDEEAVTVALDTDHRHPVTQLQMLCAEFYARGHRPKLDRLIGHRRPLATEAFDGLTPFVYDRTPLLACAEPIAPLRDHLERPGPDMVRARHRYDLDRDVYLRDHVFIGATAAKPVEQCFPVVPLTVLLESMAEVAAELAPGCVLLGLDKVAASRWVALRDATAVDTTIEAKVVERSVDGGVVVSVRVMEGGDDSCRALLRFGRAVEPSIELQFRRATVSAAWPFTVDEIYRERHLFHGPAFRCVTSLLDIDAHGCTGKVRVLPQAQLFTGVTNPALLLDPVVIDGAMQISGLFVMGRHQRLVLPTSMERVELYGPRPDDGSELLVRVGLRALDSDSKRVTTDIELLYPDGDVWMRIAGYQALILDYPESVGRSQRRPDIYHASEALDCRKPGLVAMRLPVSDLRSVNLEWLARFCLHSSEWPFFEQANLREQWELVSRMMVSKDAARALLATELGMPHPANLRMAKRGEHYWVSADDGRDCVVACRIEGGAATAVASTHEQAAALPGDWHSLVKQIERRTA